MSQKFRIFDFTLESSFPFETVLPVSKDIPDLRFELAARGETLSDLAKLRPVFDNSELIGGAENHIALYVLDGFEIIRVGSKIVFRISDDVIECRIEDDQLLWLAEMSFLGVVSSYWLERRGLTVLHSAAVGIDDGITAFLGDNGAGKSSLAATFLQAGAKFVTDDVLPIEVKEGIVTARPSYPSMRLWPVDAKRISGSDKLRRVQPGADKRRGEIGREFPGGFIERAGALTNLFVIERRTGASEVSVESLSPSQSLIELVRNSFIPRLVMAMGWQRRRLDSFVDLLKSVPVRRLVYPEGIEYLPTVRDELLQGQWSGVRGQGPGKNG